MSFNEAYAKLSIDSESATEIFQILQRVSQENNILFTFVERIGNYLRIINAGNVSAATEPQIIKERLIQVIDKTYLTLLNFVTKNRPNNVKFSINDGRKTILNKKSKAWKNFSMKATKYLDTKLYEKDEPDFNIIYDIIDLEYSLYTITNDLPDKYQLGKNEKAGIVENVFKFLQNYDTLFILASSESGNESIDFSEEWYSANEFSNITQINQEYYDTNNTTYCYCNGPYVGKMIGCDSNDCAIEWFHFDCVNLKEAPKDEWFCKETSCFPAKPNSLNLGPAKSKTNLPHKDYDQVFIPQQIDSFLEYENIKFSISNYNYIEERISKTAFNQFKGHISSENHLQLLNGTFQYLDSAIRRLLKEWSKKGVVKRFDMITIKGNSYDFTKVPLQTQALVVENMKMTSVDLYNPSSYDNQVVSFKCLLEITYFSKLWRYLSFQQPNFLSEGNFLIAKRAINYPYYFVDTFEFDVACSKEKPWVRFVSNQNFLPKNTYPLESNLTNKEKKKYYKNYLTTAEKKSIKKQEKEEKKKEKEVSKKKRIENNIRNNKGLFCFEDSQEKENCKLGKLKTLDTCDATDNEQTLNVIQWHGNIKMREEEYSSENINFLEETIKSEQEESFAFFSDIETNDFLPIEDTHFLKDLDTSINDIAQCDLSVQFRLCEKYSHLEKNCVSKKRKEINFEDYDFISGKDGDKTVEAEASIPDITKKRKLDFYQAHASSAIQDKENKSANSCIDFEIMLKNKASSKVTTKNLLQIDTVYPNDNLNFEFGIIEDEHTIMPNTASLMMSMENQIIYPSDFDNEFNQEV
ncbi:hypothetical protein QEN19_002249 [Hanseniaspora menglaensis]